MQERGNVYILYVYTCMYMSVFLPSFCDLVEMCEIKCVQCLSPKTEIIQRKCNKGIKKECIFMWFNKTFGLGRGLGFA